MTQDDPLLDAILLHVPFDGWSQAALDAGAADQRASRADLAARFPRGAVDAALAYHRRGDEAMLRRMDETDLAGLRYRDRVAAAVRFRLEAADRELVRRGVAFFSLPQHAGDGARAVWETCDRIWTALGDSSRDVNWYTKRASLAGVYSSTLLYWLGDESIGFENTWAFLDRRIEDVMRVEEIKGRARQSPLYRAFMKGPGRVFEHIRAPGEPREGYPGHWDRGA